MIEESRNQNRLDVLVGELLDGKLTEPQVDELQAILRDDDAARQLYFKHLVTHAMLDWRHGGSSVAPAEKFATATAPLAAAESLPTQSPAATNTRNTTAPDSPSAYGFLRELCNAVPFYPVVLVLAIFIVGAVWYLSQQSNSQLAREKSAPPVMAARQKAGDTPSLNAPSRVAKFTAGVQCNWSGANPSPKVGDPISVGQSLSLLSGVAEITFDVGARVILQSPASFAVDSSKSIRLDTGKLTAEITTPGARGFKVLTPDAAFVDQGTEFGVEVAPGGNSRIHVFKGEVDLALTNKQGAALPTHRLLANAGARMEGDAPTVTLVEDTGESFMRSIEQTERDLHVVAYWRFEDHPVGEFLPHTKGNTLVNRATVDSSFNGNDLFTFNQLTRPVFSKDVSAAVVPRNGRTNQNCLDNTKWPGPAQTRDLYSHSKFSHASPIDIQRITPRQWTIEASIKAQVLGRTQTFVGRDGAAAYVVTPARLAFQITSENHLAIRFRDADDRTHEVVANDFVVEAGRWYHVAAVCDARELRLYVNALDGRGYELLAATPLPRDGSISLGSGSADAAWTIGRGLGPGKSEISWPGEWFRGWIDEVRISDIALDTSGFLFAEGKTIDGLPDGNRPSGDATQAVDLQP